MKNLKVYLIGFSLSLIVISCNSGNKKSVLKNNPYLTVENDMIRTQFFAAPDTSIDIAKLKEQYQKYPERWETAFKFLATLDTNKLEFGRVDLSSDVYANFAEYTTKNIEESAYESHRNYIDLQYVVSGQEYIAANHDIASLKIIKPYDKEKDYMNYAYDGAKLLLADNQHFFIFFPTDAHMPCIKVDKKSQVKKLVIKIKYN